jgi:hypothetical protein
MSDPAADWVCEYLRLHEVQRQLREFMLPRKELLLRVAVEHVNGALHEDALNPCDRCVPQMGSYDPVDLRWYFEWVCHNAYGRCCADTCGWYVPMHAVLRGVATQLES